MTVFVARAPTHNPKVLVSFENFLTKISLREEEGLLLIGPSVRNFLTSALVGWLLRITRGWPRSEDTELGLLPSLEPEFKIVALGRTIDTS